MGPLSLSGGFVIPSSSGYPSIGAPFLPFSYGVPAVGSGFLQTPAATPQTKRRRPMSRQAPEEWSSQEEESQAAAATPSPRARADTPYSLRGAEVLRRPQFPGDPPSAPRPSSSMEVEPSSEPTACTHFLLFCHFFSVFFSSAFQLLLRSLRMPIILPG